MNRTQEKRITMFHEVFGRPPEAEFQTPGRVELVGNHTDHNGGEVLAASVHLGTWAMVARRDDRVIRVCSEGHPPVELRWDETDLRPEEKGTSVALVRGVAAAWQSAGLPVGGLDAWVTSDIPSGAGLSSSASFSVLMVSLFNGLFAQKPVSSMVVAQMARQAEVGYFGKPCGLMDQGACACGGICHMDFAHPDAPGVEPCRFDFSGHGYQLAVVNTGGSHAALTGEYAAISDDMRAVAEFLGGTRLADVEESVVWCRAPELRARFGDRVWLRATHFYAENRHVQNMVNAMKRDSIHPLLHSMRASGRSSAMRLQNMYPSGATREQPLLVALEATEEFLGGDGACRVHGGGFAGTLLACIPIECLGDYTDAMTPLFGSACIIPLEITTQGARRIDA